MEDFQIQVLHNPSSNASETNKILPITYRTKGIILMGSLFFVNIKYISGVQNKNTLWDFSVGKVKKKS